MINFINKWASGVVVAVVIGSILEMLLPENKNKKYIKTVIGLFILFTIVSPFIEKFSNGINLDSINYNEYINKQTIEVSNIDLLQQENIEEVYVENLKEKIISSIEYKGFDVENIEVSINKNQEKDYGKIIGLRLTLISKSNIKSVVIGNDKQNIDNISTAEKEDLKEYLKDNFDISKDIIIIN